MRRVRRHTVSIVGTWHCDPQCRLDVLAKLRELKAQRGVPLFVAVEFTSSLRDLVNIERESLLREALSAWDGIPSIEQSVETLVQTYHFETDVHLASFPLVNLIYLEDGRLKDDGNPLTLPRSGEDWFRVLYANPLDKTEPSDNDAVTRDVCHWVHERPSIGPEVLICTHRWDNGERRTRDERWTDRIIRALGDDTPQWAIAIVGTGHTEDQPGSLRRLLRANQADVDVYPATCHR